MLFNFSPPNVYLSVCRRSKYFRGKKLFGDWDVRVEQAEFHELNLAAYSDTGVMVDIQVIRGGNKVVRSVNLEHP